MSLPKKYFTQKVTGLDFLLAGGVVVLLFIAPDPALFMAPAFFALIYFWCMTVLQIFLGIRGLALFTLCYAAFSIAAVVKLFTEGLGFGLLAAL